jgi:rhodanese-related sulfurtransferase
MQILLFSFLLLALNPAIVHFDELKSWYKESKKMVVVDARKREAFDNTLLPYAKWLPYNSSEREIQATIPTKETPVVVYCWNIHCPEANLLAENLIKFGYQNVTKYPEGLQDWSLNGMPVFQKKLK